MKKLNKILAREIKENTMLTLNQIFTDLIREKMTDKQFWTYVASWKDASDVCDEMEGWDDEEKKEAIKDINKL